MFTKLETFKLKGIAIMLLLFHHLFYSLDKIHNYKINTIFLSDDQLSLIATCARICVWIFAFLSAYGLTKQYELTGEWKLLKRWISLMKSYWFVYILFFVFSFFFFVSPLEKYDKNIVYAILDFFALSDLFKTPTLQAVWWYMCFAQILLLLIPVIFKICKNFGISTLFLTFILLQYIPDGIVSQYGGNYMNYLLVIVFGVVAAQNNIFEKKNNRSPFIKYIEGVILIAFFMLCSYLRVKYNGDNDFYNINSIFSVIAIYCITKFAVDCFSKNSMGISKLLEILGKHSTNIFLTHAFLYNYYPKIIYFSHNVFITFILLLFLSVLVSVLIEKIKCIFQYDRVISILINKIN